ncbi:MAG TPA: DEAD/DEAH box helicase [Ktedonobacterales bacterium]
MQRKLAHALVQGHRVIAAQPTDTGKTLAATLPFAVNILSPAQMILQMIFMTPLRTLTSTQASTLAKEIRGDIATRYLCLPQWAVT